MNATSERDRYFLALWPPDAVRDDIALAASNWLADMPGRCRRIGANRYHLTLLYLGALDTHAVERLPAFLADVAAIRMHAFELVLDRAGHFRAHAGWLGCTRIPARVTALHDRLEQDARRHGMLPSEPQTDFVPHVTVARDAHGGWPASSVFDAAVAWPVREFVLVRSVPAEHFAYRTMARFPLSDP